jgi:hypothetical protein
MKKTKWVVLAGLLLTVPATTVLSGCSGGGGGGATIPVFGGNQFAGVQANGQLLNGNNQPVGTVTFRVNNNGGITGTLTADQIAGNAIRAIQPRGTATNGTGTVNNDGTFTMTFDVRSTGNVNGIVTLTGRLVRNGATISAQDLQFESPFAGFAGPYNLTITTTIPNPGGGGGNGSGTFTISNANATNADTSAISPNSAVATAIRVNNQITSLTLTFIQASATLPRTVTVSIGDGVNPIAPGTFGVGNGSAVIYSETSVANQQTRTWGSDETGSVTLNSLSATQAQVTINNVLLTPQAIPGAASNPTGSFRIGGSGTATIQ